MSSLPHHMRLDASGQAVEDVDGPPTKSAVTSRLPIDATLVASWLFLSVIAGYTLVGYSRDYFEYLTYYLTIPTTFSLLDTRFEPGFHATAWIFRNWLNADLSTLVLFLTSISLGIKFYLFRRYLRYPLLAIFFYVIIFYPIHEYTQYRVGISLALGYLAVHLLLERRLTWAALLFFLSFSFHYSSILIVLVVVGSMILRGRAAIVALLIAATVGSIFIGQLRVSLSDVFNTLNPLSGTYLENKAMIDGVSLLSVNNLLLAAAAVCYLVGGYYARSRYHASFLTMTIACLVPIALLPDAPVIAQRSKEVLFVAFIFLACRSKLVVTDAPALAFLVAMTALLGYLSITGGVIFS